jgi:hypothetical protein
MKIRGQEDRGRAAQIKKRRITPPLGATVRGSRARDLRKPRPRCNTRHTQSANRGRTFGVLLSFTLITL